MNWTALIVLNNYFHDVATATLLSSAVILWVLGRQAQRGGPEDRRALAKAMPTLNTLRRGRAGLDHPRRIPRLIFFKTFEFIPAKDNAIIIDLAIKHVFMFAAVVAGSIMWARIGKIARCESDV